MAFGTHEMVKPGNNKLARAAALGALARGGHFKFDIEEVTDLGATIKTLEVQIYDVSIGDVNEPNDESGRLFFSAHLINPEHPGPAVVNFSPDLQNPSGRTLVDITLPEQEVDVPFDGPTIGL